MTKILIVEDDSVIRESLVQVLAPYNLTVRGVASVAEAMAEMDSRGDFDLILSDHALGGTESGLDLWLYCQQAYPQMPFVLMSGNPEDVFQKLLHLGIPCPPFLPKPFTKDQCWRTLEALMRAA